MEIRKVMSGLVKKVRRHPVRAIGFLGLLGLSALTSAKDNVHFGAVTLNNPQGNHYAWGVYPKIEVKGEGTGNMLSIGLYGCNEVVEDSELVGNLRASGFVGCNFIGRNSELNGNVGVYNIVGGENYIEEHGELTGNMGAYGIVGGENCIEPYGELNGDMKAGGIIVGYNNIKPNGIIRRGDAISRGICTTGPKGYRLGTNVELGIEDYVGPD